MGRHDLMAALQSPAMCHSPRFLTFRKGAADGVTECHSSVFPGREIALWRRPVTSGDKQRALSFNGPRGKVLCWRARFLDRLSARPGPAGFWSGERGTGGYSPVSESSLGNWGRERKPSGAEQ